MNTDKTKITCKYCKKSIGFYYLNIHHNTKKCLIIRNNITNRYKLINDIINNNTEKYNANECMLCNKHIRSKAKCKEDEIDIDFSKVHRLCMEIELRKQNNDIRTIINSSIEI